MISLNAFERVRSTDLTAIVARSVMARKSMVMPYADFTDMVCELLMLFASPEARLVAAGPVPAQVAQAADRAAMELIEQSGHSPFVGDASAVIAGLNSKHDVVYVGNPNRITGASFSLSQIEQLADAVPNGLLILDEYYYDYYGITGYPLVDMSRNVVILRSFTAAYPRRNTEAGYLITSPNLLGEIQRSCDGRGLSQADRRFIVDSMINHEETTGRLYQLHQESLRLSTRLTRMGAQCRICASDFLLMRVAEPTAILEALAPYKLPLQGLAMYPRLRKYLRYEVQDRAINDNLLQAISSLPKELLQAEGVDRQIVQLNRPGEKPAVAGRVTGESQ